MNNERVVLAQELHDGIAQDLVVLGFSIDSILSRSKDEKIRSELRELRFTVTTLLEKIRVEMHQLRGGTPLISNNSSLDTFFEVQRILIELLRNVERHSEASILTVLIEDNGKGGVVEKAGSFGLQGVQERVSNINGEIEIVSDPNGTRIRLQIPLDR